MNSRILGVVLLASTLSHGIAAGWELQGPPVVAPAKQLTFSQAGEVRLPSFTLHQDDILRATDDLTIVCDGPIVIHG